MPSYRQVEPSNWNYEALEKSSAMLRLSKEPLDWVPGMLSLWRPPGGYTQEILLVYEAGNVLAVPGMLLQGMLIDDEFPETKLMFLDCCAKFWEDLLIAE